MLTAGQGRFDAVKLLQNEFADESGSTQRVIDAFGLHETVSDGSKPAINQRHDFVLRKSITLLSAT